MNLLTEFFSLILELSADVVPVLAVVLLVRLVLARRASRRVLYALWAVVGLRLVVPGAIPSPMSLFNLRSVQQVQATAATVAPALGEMNRTIAVTPPPQQTLPAGMEILPTMVDPSRPSLLEILALVWLLGLMAMVLVSIWNYSELKRRLRTAVLLEGNVFQCDAIDTPFVLGLLRPKIYIPFRLEGQERDYVLLHERTHIARRDHLVKPLAFLLLAAYWFHPGVWLAWLGLGRDMELCCDEAVLRTLGTEVKTAYSRSLLDFATARRFPAPSPLAFGEHDAAARIRHVLRWKKAAPATAFLAISLCVLTVIICGTDGQGQSTLRNRGEKSVAEAEVYTMSYTLGADVREASVYEEIYYQGKLVSSRPVMEGALNYQADPSSFLNHWGTLRIGADIDKENNTLSWVREDGGKLLSYPVNLEGRAFGKSSSVYGALGTNERMKKVLSDGSILLYVALGTDDGRQDLPWEATDLSGTWPEVWQQGFVNASDYMVLLRLKLTPAVGTVKQTNNGFSFSLDQDVQALSYYADVYEKGQLLYTQLLSREKRGQGLRREFVESWMPLQFEDKTQVFFQRTSGGEVTNTMPVPVPAGYQQTGSVWLGAEQQTRQWDLKMGGGLYILGAAFATEPNGSFSFSPRYPDLKDCLIHDNDLVALLRVVPEVVAEVRAEKLDSNGKNAAGRFAFTSPPEARSFVLYQEVYENGQMQSSSPLIMDDFDGGATDRQFSLDIKADANLQTGQVGWDIRFDGGSRMTFPNHGSDIGELPVSGMSANVWDTDGEAQPLALEENLILMVFGLTNRNESSHYFCQSLMDGVGWEEMLATNDRVILLRLKISTEDIDSATATLPGVTRQAESKAPKAPDGEQAQRIWEERVTKLELFSGAMDLWSAVDADIEGMRGNTSYSPSFFTDEGTDVLQFDFASPPDDRDALDRAMWEKGCLMLALVGNLGEFRWTYPGTENGEETRIINYLPLADAQSNLRVGEADNAYLSGYKSIKDCAASPADVKNLLDCLFAG